MSEALTPISARRGRRLRIAPAAALIICTVLFVAPVATMAVGAFRSSAPGVAGDWTADPLTRTWSQGHTVATLRDSLALAVVVSVLSTLAGAYLAFLVARTDTALRRLIPPLAAFTLAMPPLFFAISWSLLGNSSVGALNRLLQQITGTGWAPVNIESWAGLVFVLCLKTTGLTVLLLVAPFRAMDSAQEEAALMAGAGRVRAFFTVDLRALAPAVLGVAVLGVIIGLEYFDVPLILGTPAGISVFSTDIYASLNHFTPPRYAEASALSLALIVLLLALFYFQQRILRGRDFSTVRGKAGRAQQWRLGRFRFVGTAFILLFGVLAVVLPMAQLVLVSFTPYFGVYDTLTTINYQTLFHDAAVGGALWSTAWLALLGGLLAVVVCLLVTYAARRAPRLVAGYLRLSAWLPWSLPGTALALGLLWLLLTVPLVSGLYGTTALLVIGMLLAATPIAMRSVEPAVGQIGPELEEAAWISGAPPHRGFRDVVLRLVLPSLLTGWLMAAILVAGNLAIPLMLGTVDTTTVPTLVYDLYGSGRAPEAAAVLCVALAIGMVAGAALFLLKRLVRRQKPPFEPGTALPEES